MYSQKQYNVGVWTQDNSLQLKLNDSTGIWEYVKPTVSNRIGGELALSSCVPGFVHSREFIKPLSWQIKYDPHAIVSLILMDYNLDYLTEFCNMLPIMAINVSRLVYTIDAFAISKPEHTYNDALKFYIQTDVNHVSKITDGNLRFSIMLHCLQSSGYEEYILELCRYLDLNANIIPQSHIVHRYKNIKYSLADVTAIYHEHYWYVQVGSVRHYSPCSESDIVLSQKNSLYFKSGDVYLQSTQL